MLFYIKRTISKKLNKVTPIKYNMKFLILIIVDYLLDQIIPFLPFRT